jgi:hypothetical protein
MKTDALTPHLFRWVLRVWRRGDGRSGPKPIVQTRAWLGALSCSVACSIAGEAPSITQDKRPIEETIENSVTSPAGTHA